MKPVKNGKLAEEVDLKKDLANDVTRKKIKKHLSDINDVISEEDIRNVIVPGSKKRKEKTKKADTVTPAKVEVEPPTKEEGDSPKITTWNILEE